jgi:hypothetical protein
LKQKSDHLLCPGGWDAIGTFTELNHWDFPRLNPGEIEAGDGCEKNHCVEPAKGV